MFSKKEDFTNNIQYKIGLRIDELKPSDFNSIDDLLKLFESKNNDSNWKPLHFLSTYFLMKDILEKINRSSEKILSTTNLNDLLNKNQKVEFLNEIKTNNIIPIEQARPDSVTKLIVLFTAVSIMGSMLISTYLITAKEYSGWIYLTGLVGLILSIGLIKITEKLKTQFKPNTLLEYAKSTFVVRHESLKDNPHTQNQLADFLLEELNLELKKDFTISDSIPEN